MPTGSATKATTTADPMISIEAIAYMNAARLADRLGGTPA